MKQLFVISVTAGLLLLARCSMQQSDSTEGSENTTQTSTSATETTASVTQATTTQPMGSINPLTGQADFNPYAVGKRPVAVMVNNVAVSLPQYGIAAADILFEIPVEAGITRLMAMYADYTAVPDVCSVRSCRYYYPLLAYGYDAVYCHWGSDRTIAKDTLERLNIDRLDGAGKAWQKCYFRDADRVQQYAVEHTGYLSGKALADTMEAFGIRTRTDYGTAFSFTAPDALRAVGDVCTAVTLRFSGAYRSGFVYNADSHRYYKNQNDKPHIDSRTQTQLAFTNVFILHTQIQPRADGYLMDVDLSGGEGYYLSCGAVQPILWEKTADAAPITVYDTTGSPLQVNAGKSYIGIIDADRPIDWNE